MLSYRWLGHFWNCVLLIVLGMPCSVRSQDSDKEPLIPQNLLKLIHAPEVQEELGVLEDKRLLEILREIDAIWWPARILPEDKQIETIRDLEKRLLEELKSILTPEKLRRLREIEVQSQGTRSLLRSGIAKSIGLNDQQLNDIKKACLTTDGIARKLNEKQGGDTNLEKQLKSAREKEQTAINGALAPANRQALAKLIGKPFDTMALKRVFPLAPELIDSGEWTGSERPTLDSLRGNVVLVHFYAFQCHNCVANFDHYNRWHESLSEKGVKVIGIQSPETAAERDPSLVKQAALKKGFGFPVLIDLNKKNWDAWGTIWWPTVYVVDKRGYIRSLWEGELNWQGATGDKAIEKLVDELLAEKE
ncbi:redoxin domain-containing protein [Pirellulaceae bacterium SH449]